jgi:signal transduction histidine kinase
MQWAREDGVGSHISEILEGYEQLKTQPYFIRGTSELLLSMAFLEMKNLMLAEKFLNAAEETLRLVNSSYVFNSYFKKIRTEIGTPSEVPILASASTLSPDFENLIRLKFGVVQTERLSVLQSEISDHLLTATTPLSDDDFAKKFREDLQFTLPEFRVAIRATDKWQHHDGTPLPLTSNAIEQLFGSALVDQVSSVSFCAQNGRAWQGFLVRVENGMSMLIAAPYIASQHYNRLILGEQFSDLFLIGALRRRIQSDRQRLEQQKNLLAQQAQLTDLAAQVAHDIRSPLSALRIIADRAGLASDQNEHVSLLKQSVMRISDIANDLLVRSRIRPVAFIDRTNRYRVVDAIMPLLEEKKALLLSRPGITIGQDVTERSEEICTTVSESDLKRALSNVINNAMEAIAEKVDSCGRITVSLRLYSSFFAISVEDDGIGIDAEVLPLLGTRGFSISKVASCASKGSGLGLAHARALCESAQGRLQIQSKLGFGTIVTLVLPVEQQYLI